MFMTNKDIEILIRIENLVGMNEKKLFDSKGEFHYVETYYENGKKYTEPATVTMGDFVDYINLVEKVLLQREENRRRSREFVRNNPEKHNEYNKAWYRRVKAKKTQNDKKSIDNIKKYQHEYYLKVTKPKRQAKKGE